MSLDPEIKVTKFGNVSKAIQEGNQAALASLVARVSAQAKSFAPVDLGQLRNSIMGRVKQHDFNLNNSGGESAPAITPRAREGEGYVGSNTLYSVYQEFGTRRTNAQPYLRPAIAIEANGMKVAAAVKKYENESVQREVRKGPKKSKVYK